MNTATDDFDAITDATDAYVSRRHRLLVEESEKEVNGLVQSARVVIRHRDPTYYGSWCSGYAWLVAKRDLVAAGSPVAVAALRQAAESEGLADPDGVAVELAAGLFE